MGIRSIGHYDLEAESLDDLASGLHFTLSEEIDLPGTLSSIYLDITLIPLNISDNHESSQS